MKGGIMKRYNTTACMVDNNRAISILGGDMFGDASKKAELFALNCNKSVSLRDMEIERDKALSLYSNDLHKIFIVDVLKEKKRYYRNEGKYYWSNNRYLEWYDINKDKWVLIEDHCIDMQELSNMYISKIDPNILIFVGRKDDNIITSKWDLRANEGGIINRLDMALPSNYLRYDLCALYL